jgi:hypothetical protein
MMTITRSRGLFGLAAALLAIFVLAGCNQHRDKIGDIVSDPAHFRGKDVTIAGEVTQRYELPLGIADVAAYRISDGTGQIWVLSRAGAPIVGDKVGLKGKVHEEGSIGNLVLGDVVEETERKVQ